MAACQLGAWLAVEMNSSHQFDANRYYSMAAIMEGAIIYFLRLYSMQPL